MTRRFLKPLATSTLALALCLLSGGLNANEPQQPQQPTDAQVATRSGALEVAGAFSNDEFVLRDGHHWGTLQPGKGVVIQVNLFAGNQYWFVAAASPEAKHLVVSLYGEDGKQVPYEPYYDGVRAAAGFSPSVSGPYYVRISGAEDADTPATFCLLYSYK